MFFLSTFGLSNDASGDSSNLDGETLTSAARIHLVGKPLSGVIFPDKMQPSHCEKRDASGLDCEFWLASGPVRERGLRVQLMTDPSGIVREARISNLNRIFGTWKFET
jgi:hypothetical protein